MTRENYTSQDALRGLAAVVAAEGDTRRAGRQQPGRAGAVLGGAEELAESEALAGGAGKGAGPEEGETLKRKQQQAERL